MTKTNVEGTFTKVSDTLIEDEKYKDLSGLSILLYSLYARRLTCSINSAKNGNEDFIDEKGKPYIIFTNEEAAEKVRTTSRTVSKLRKELVNHGLISVKRLGLKHYKIYVHEPQASVQKKAQSTNKSSSNNDINNVNEDLVEIIDQYVSEDNSVTGMKNNPISEKDSKRDIYNNTNETYESNTNLQKVSNQPSPSSIDSKVDYNVNKTAMLALKNRISNVLTPAVWGRVEVLAQGDYKQAKFIVNTIFKAKSQVTNKLLSSSNWLYNPASQEATRFETNNLLIKGLESALIRMTEIIYKGQEKVRNTESFMYSYIRNNIANSIKTYLSDNFELAQDELIEVNSLTSFGTRPQYAVA